MVWRVFGTSALPRPKPLTMGPERRMGKGGEGPVEGPMTEGREVLGGIEMRLGGF